MKLGSLWLVACVSTASLEVNTYVSFPSHGVVIVSSFVLLRFDKFTAIHESYLRLWHIIKVSKRL